MNAWVQAIVWRYKEGLFSDPATACAEELMYVHNNINGTNFKSIDDELEGWSFRDRALYILGLGEQGVWGECDVYEYHYAGPGSSIILPMMYRPSWLAGLQSPVKSMT